MGVAQAQEEAETVASGRGKYNAYTAQERAKNAAEHGSAKTVRHCPRQTGSARRLRFRSYARTRACAYKLFFFFR